MPLYGAIAGAQANSHLYEIDPATGATTDIGDIGRAITALASDPTTGILYGVSSPQSVIEPKCLFTIDPATGAATVIWEVQLDGGDTTPYVVADIAFDDSGQMWGFMPEASIGRKLARIDKTTALFTPLGTSGMTSSNCGYGMDFDADGVLWCFAGGTNSGVYTLNTTTGARTSVGTADAPPGSVNACIGAASFDGSLMWLIGSQSVTELFTTDLVPVTSLYPLTSIGLLTPFGGYWDALAWHEAAVSGGRFWNIKWGDGFVVTDEGRGVIRVDLA